MLVCFILLLFCPQTTCGNGKTYRRPHRPHVGGPVLVIRGRLSSQVEGEVAPVDIRTLQHLPTVLIPLLASEEEVVHCLSGLSTRTLI
jgi:hypothetical protein